MVQAFCVKCKKKVEIKKPKQVTLKNKRPAIKGTCPVCGTITYRMGRYSKKKKTLKGKLGLLKLFF
ncbi:MAG: DUF5679 domain-containing protein [Candidatus Methylarchaceae archaeon HK02M2]|nr:DUF5679 domain-containing protein [Candidatus Methylarchaceae archaeon HK02M2]